jgi:hypothetical protein
MEFNENKPGVSREPVNILPDNQKGEIPHHKKRNIVLITIIILVVTIATGIAGWMFMQRLQKNTSQNQSKQLDPVSSQTENTAEQDELLAGEESIPSGYFVPSTKSIPAGFVGRVNFLEDAYGAQFDNRSDMNGIGNPSSLFISEAMESATNNYDSRLAYYKNLSSEENREIKEFDFEGIHGIVMDSTIYPGNNDHDLLAKDGQRVLSILARDGTKTKFSSDDLILMLKTFIRIPSQSTQNDSGASQSAIPTAPSSEDLNFSNYSDDSYQALSSDSQQVVTGYLWHSYKGSPNFKSVMLPVWGDSTDKDTSKNEYNIDIWDGKHFVFYKRTTPAEEIVFPQGGVYMFRVTGIDPNFQICPSDRGYFWAISYISTGTFNGTRVPLADKKILGKTCSSNGIN